MYLPNDVLIDLEEQILDHMMADTFDARKTYDLLVNHHDIRLALMRVNESFVHEMTVEEVLTVLLDEEPIHRYTLSRRIITLYMMAKNPIVGDLQKVVLKLDKKIVAMVDERPQLLN